MIRAKFKHSRKGVVFQRDEEITNLTKAEQEEAVLNKLAYYDKPKVEILSKPTDSNTVDYIKDYLEQEGIEYDSNLRKAELLELC